MSDSTSYTHKEFLVTYRIWGYVDEVVTEWDEDNSAATNADRTVKDSVVNEFTTAAKENKDQNISGNTKFTEYQYDDVGERWTDDVLSRRNQDYAEKVNVKSIGTVEVKKESNVSTKTLETELSNEKVHKKIIKKNVYKVLQENTVAIEFQKITERFPKYKDIKKELMNYVVNECGIDEDKIDTVSILNIVTL